MADKKTLHDAEGSEVVIARAKDFWERYSKPIMIICTVIIVAVGGYFIYQKYFEEPQEVKAADAIFKAEEYYRIDSLNLALNGDGQNPGFLRVIDKFGGTDAGNLARYYAGVIYVKMDDNEKAIKYLKKFSTSSKPTQAKAYRLLADAYGDLGKNKDAFDYYKKSAHEFEEDESNSAESLFFAAYLAQRSLNDTKSAIDLYKELKEKFPRSQQAQQADNYLAQMGVYSSTN
jgi:hypothetical protein